MIAICRCLGLPGLALLFALSTGQAALGQSFGDSAPQLVLPNIQSYAAPMVDSPLAIAGQGQLTVTAHLTQDDPPINRGLVWRIFKPEPGPDGRLPLVASAQGGTGIFSLEPGSFRRITALYSLLSVDCQMGANLVIELIGAVLEPDFAKLHGLCRASMGCDF
jgi:hypothetical protein